MYKRQGDSCLDVDAVDILVKCSLLTQHLACEVQVALEKALWGLLKNQGKDGGFCRALHRPLPRKSWKRRYAEIIGLDELLKKPYKIPRDIQYYTDWIKMPFDIRQSDLWSTWFRSYGIAIIRTRYPDQFPAEEHWGFRRIPALGWHDMSLVKSGR